MSMWEKLKRLFSRQKLLNVPEPENQPEYKNNIKNSDDTHVLTRADGSIVKVTPIVSELGQTYEQVYNRRTGEMQAIPKFKILSEDLDGRIMGKEILMDIDPQLLNDPQYANFIANKMLSAKRMEKMVHEYGNYAGTIRTDENGRLIKMKDEGIIKTLNASQAENAKRVAAEDAKKIAAIREAAENIELNIKGSHAENLSGQEWNR